MKRFAKFFIVGVFAFCVDSGVLTLLMKFLNFGPYSARLVSFLCAVTFSWTGNRLFTFRDRHQMGLGRQWLAFFTVNVGGFVVNYGTYALAITYVPLVRAYPVLGVAAGAIAGMFLNFGTASTFVFPHREMKAAQIVRQAPGDKGA